jgi:anti-anti-sigma regulatory factor
MEFKIDTKDTFTNVMPVTERLDANLTEAIRQKWNKAGQSGSLNLIVDLQNIKEVDSSAFFEMLALQEDFKKNDQSIAFTGLQEKDMQQVRKQGDEAALNVVPTKAEAIDMINMEIVERDLFKDE